MKHAYRTIFIVTAVFIITFGLAAPRMEFSPKIMDKEVQDKYNHYENPQVCLGCHVEKFDTWKTSQMSKGFTGDFFQAQYYKLAVKDAERDEKVKGIKDCLLYTSPSPRDRTRSRMPSSA